MDRFCIKIGVFPVCPSLVKGEGTVLFPQGGGGHKIKFSAYNTSSLVWILRLVALATWERLAFILARLKTISSLFLFVCPPASGNSCHYQWARCCRHWVLLGKRETGLRLAAAAMD